MSIDYKLQSYSFKEKPLFDFVKRCIDIIFALAVIILFSWLFLLVAIIIKIDTKGTVFFAHKRVGKKGKQIKILKFRTMVPNAEDMIKDFSPEQMEEYKRNFKLEKDHRITKVGGFLRKTSLDEFPQFLNLLKGDLTLIGPRPVLEEETQLYGEHRDLLLKVKPGITGIWAANGRSHIDYQQRIDMELYYICKRSFLLDIKLFFKTIVSVFKQEGAK